MDRENNVAVVIACYDSEKFIGRAIRSALEQAETAEVFVVDDASADASVEAALAGDDGSGRLKVLRQPSNRGPSAARNRGIFLARSPWLAVLDADDFFLPNRLAGLLRHSQDADFIADDPLRVAENAIDGPRQAILGLRELQWITFAEFVSANVSHPDRAWREWGYVQPLMRRQFLTDHGLRHQEQMRLGEDYELYARALALGARFVMTPLQGYVCVCREGSLSGRHSVDDLRNVLDCDQSLATLPGLTAEDREVLRQHSLSIECRVQWRLLVEAFKQGNAFRAAACFLQPQPIPGYLLRELFSAVRGKGPSRPFSTDRYGRTPSSGRPEGVPPIHDACG